MNIAELKRKLITEEAHNFDSLCLLVELLRSEEGCMWDREQDHKSIRSDIIEETYEVVEAIDKDDMTLLREELGDVLFQVMFHSQIEREKGTFNINDVIGDVIDKMILRHPHVFGEVQVGSSGEILDNWEKIKTVEKSRLTVREILEAVPKQYPALLRAKKVVKKARKNGLEVSANEDTLAGLVDKLRDAGEEDRSAILTEIIFTSVVMSGESCDVEKNLSFRVNDFIDGCTEEN
ncbi:MAG: MazG family protein [Ruminococcaceae bacterium]|nr:MazG family protein [Oscillospiraceae bacterium]